MITISGYIWLLDVIGFPGAKCCDVRTLETNRYGASLPHVFFGDLAHYSEGCLTSGGLRPAMVEAVASKGRAWHGVAPSKHRSILNIVRMGMGWMQQLDRECLYIKRPWGFGMLIKQPKVITEVDVPDNGNGPSVWFPPQRSNIRMFHDVPWCFMLRWISWRKVARPHCQRQQRGFSARERVRFSSHPGSFTPLEPIGHNKQRLKQASSTRISLGILADQYDHD